MESPEQPTTQSTKISDLTGWRRVMAWLLFTAKGRWTLAGGVILLLLLVDYFTSVRISEISATTDLDARGGEIRIVYNKVPSEWFYTAGSPELTIEHAAARGENRRRTQIYRIVKPTKYHQSYELVLADRRKPYLLFGLFTIPKKILITTGIEKVKIATLIPSPARNPTPDELENQIGIQFQGEVRGDFKTGTNISVKEMTYVTMEPKLPGYYRWVDDSLLTFNFTEVRPDFKTTYTFTAHPDKIIKPDYQKWVGDTDTASLTTGPNEVYVTSFSLHGDQVNWTDPLRIEFSGPMVGALDVLKNLRQDQVPIRIAPKPGGTWQWLNAKLLEFRPDTELGWPVRRSISVKIFPAINQEAGRSWRLGTAPDNYEFYVLPRKQSILNYNLRGTAQLDEDLIITFSHDMVEISEAAKKIQPGAPGFVDPIVLEPKVDGYFYWQSRSQLAFHPTNLWSELTDYVVTLNPKYNPDPRFEWTGIQKIQFRTVENVVHAGFYMTPEEQVSPGTFFSSPGGYEIGKDKKFKPEERLWVTFDKKIGHLLRDGISMRDAVQITPPIEGEYKWLSPSLLEFVPAQNWKQNAEYEVALAKVLLSHPQQHFGKGEERAVFQTGPNLVEVAPFKDYTAERPVSIEPDKTLILRFSKNVNTLFDIGRRSKLAELPKDELPFDINPAVDVTVSWDSKRALIIEPEEYWDPETTYRLTLSSHILPQTEARLALEQPLTFKTQKNVVSVLRMTPSGLVGRRIQIEMDFSKRIKPSGVPLGEETIPEMLEIEPAIRGAWAWVAPDKIKFTPSEALAPATSYKVILDPNRIRDKRFTWYIPIPKDKKEYELVTFQFRTAPLQVARTDARFEFNREDLLKQRFFLDIELSEPVKEEDLRKHFSIWYKQVRDGISTEVPLIYKLTPLRQESEGVLQYFSVVSDWIDRPGEDRTIEYEIKSGLKPIIGNLDLAVTYQSNFLQERPKYLSITGVTWDREENRYRARLGLNAPVDPADLKAALKIAEITTLGTPQNVKEFDISVDSTSTAETEFDYRIEYPFKPQGTYRFTVQEGLLAADGAFSREAIQSTPDPVPDLPRKLQFGLDGTFLSFKDLTKVPIVTVNQETFWLTIEHIYPNNVDFFVNHLLDAGNIGSVAKIIHQQEYSVSKITRLSSVGNQEITTHLDLSHLFQQHPKGMFRISLSQSKWSSSAYASQSRWFLATDLGLVARTFGDLAVVWANSLQSTSSLGGVGVRAIDEWNQVIDSATTDGDGVARLRLRGRTVNHLVAVKDDDFSFLDMRKHRESLSAFNVEGIQASKTNLRSYIYSERGVYRPSETAHIVCVTRGPEGVLPDSYTLRFKLTGPTGREAVAQRFRLDESGTYAFDFEVPAEAKTGKWVAEVVNDGATIGSYTFQVEEFIPAKLKVQVSHTPAVARPGGELNVQVVGKLMFGPPAADRVVTGSVNLRPNYFKPAGHGQFQFGHDDTKFQRVDYEFPESKLDSDGLASFTYTVPENLDSPIGLKAHYSATVIDDGGRAVTSYGDADVLLFSQFVGIRRLTEDVTQAKRPIGFEIVNVDASGRSIPRGQQSLQIRVYRNKYITHYRKNERGYFRYVTEKERILVTELVDSRDDQGKLAYVPELGGEYILEAQDKIGGQVTRYPFQVYSDESTGQAVLANDRVELKVRQKRVSVNSDVTVDLRTPFDGKVLLTGERDQVLFSRVLQTENRRASVQITVPPGYLPNFYLSAMVLQPVRKAKLHTATYAIGIVNVDVVDPSHTPQLTLDMPERANPNGKLTVNLQVSDTNQKPMHYTVAAVDEGILQLTDFQLPDMKDFFNMKRRLEVAHYNLYQALMPHDEDVKYELSPSGDAPSRALIKKKRVNPESQARVQSVALWSGLLDLGPEGHGQVSFDIPDFDGNVRVMVVVFGDQRFASAEKDVLVRDQLVIKPTLPRFIAAGDSFYVPVAVFNATPSDGTFSVDMQLPENVEADSEPHVDLPVISGKEGRTGFFLKAKSKLGVAKFEVIGSGNGERTRRIVNVPVRSPGILATHMGSGTVKSGEPRVIPFPHKFEAGSETMAMKISGHPLTRQENALRFLLTYPHGCLEQTTSKLFPLLFFQDLAQAAGADAFGPQGPRFAVRKGIEKLERMQLEDGAFAFWEGRSMRNDYATVYAAHFLIEARQQGFQVDEAVWNNMVFQLQRIVNDESTGGGTGQTSTQLYAAFVLALANEPVFSKLNFLYDNRFDFMETQDKARLAMAFFLAGQQDKAKEILKAVSGFDSYSSPYRRTGGTFASNTRDLAVILDAYTMIQPDSDKIDVIVRRLNALMQDGHWGTTQDDAMALLAVGRAHARTEKAKISGDVTLGDGSIRKFSDALSLGTPEMLNGDVRVNVQSEGEVYFRWESMGIEPQPEALQVDKGLRVRRRYLTEKGETLDLEKIRQGDLIVVEVTATAQGSLADNVVIEDLLPMGLEIENPRLATSARMDWIASTLEPDYVDMRDDRINIYTSLSGRETRYYYATRAVSIGQFAVPRIHAEAMYDPSLYSSADGGKMRVLAPEGL